MFRKSSRNQTADNSPDFTFKKYKGTKSKQKTFHVDNEYIADEKNKPVIKLKQIEQIAFGKYTTTFATNPKMERKPHYPYLSIIATKEKNNIDLEELSEGDRLRFTYCLLEKLKNLNKGISEEDRDRMMLAGDEDAILLMNMIYVDNDRTTETNQLSTMTVTDVVNMSDDRTEFTLKRLKVKGSKEKTIKFMPTSIVDEKDRSIIKYKNIAKIAIGKKTETLMNNKKSSKRSHAYYFSFIDFDQQSIDFEVANSADRYFVIIQTLIKLNKNKDAIKKVIASYQDKDESFLISINHNIDVSDNDDATEQTDITKRESQRASAEAFEKALRKEGKYDDEGRNWIFKRHKSKGSKEGNIELTKDALIWNNKNRIKLTDLKEIMLGKQSELLSDVNNKHFVNKPNEIFISFMTDKETFDLSEIEKNDRLDLMFKILAQLREIQHKHIEGGVTENDIIRESADKNFRASFAIVEAFEKALRKDENYDDDKRNWIFKRHKSKGSKEGNIELTKDELIWNNKNRIKLTDLKEIMLGKQSELLSDVNNKHFVNKPNEIFISFMTDKETFDLSEIEKNDRLDLMFKILAQLREIQHKHIEGGVTENDIIRESADKNFRASFTIVEDEEMPNESSNVSEEEPSALEVDTNEDQSQVETATSVSKSASEETWTEQTKKSEQPEKSSAWTPRKSSLAAQRYRDTVASMNNDSPSTKQSSTWGPRQSAMVSRQYRASMESAASPAWNQNNSPRNEVVKLQRELDEHKRKSEKKSEEVEILQEELKDVKYDYDQQVKENELLQKKLDSMRKSNQKSSDWNARKSQISMDNLQTRLSSVIEENERLKSNQSGTVSVSKSSKHDLKKINDLQSQLDAALVTINELKLQLRQRSNGTYRGASDGKTKAERLKYIENVRSVLSESDWINFRRLMKNVANHAQQSKGMKVDKENYNRKRHIFVDKLVYDLYGIFNEYPMASQHLMRDFEVVIPNETERYMFIQSMMNEKDNGSYGGYYLDHQKIYKEFEEKVKLMQQQVTDQSELKNAKFAHYEQQKIVLPKIMTDAQEIEMNEFADRIKKDSENTDPNRVRILKQDECDMILHGIASTYPMKLTAMDDSLMIGRSKFPYSKIYKVEIGDVSLFHGAVDMHRCMILLTSQGTIQLEAPTELLRDQWLRQIELRNTQEEMRSFDDAKVNFHVSISSPTHFEDTNANVQELAVGAEAIYTPQNVYNADNLDKMGKFDFQSNWPRVA